jgi:thioesterase domain-containing protein
MAPTHLRSASEERRLEAASPQPTEAVTQARRGFARDNGLPVVFLFPGSVGYGRSLAALAGVMAGAAQIVPVRYPDLRMMLAGRSSLAAMADDAMEQIGRKQPNGPVRLLGHSLGGAVAFEVAGRLLASGRTVRFLGILDTSILGERSEYRETFSRTVQRIRTSQVTAARMACRGLAKIAARFGCEALLARMVDRKGNNQFNATRFRITLELQEVLRSRAFFRWLDQPKADLPLTATLFRCARKDMPQHLGWDGMFARLDVIAIDGGHIDLIMQPHLTRNHPLIEEAVVRSYAPAEIALRGAAS